MDVRTEDERERGFDAHLRQMLRETTAGSSSACLDAETLAAWSAGALPPLQARAVESHVASCATCGAMLAAFARADVDEPSPVAEEMPFWRRWRLQWVMPIAATATALAVWVAVPDRSPVPAPLPSTPEATSVDSPPAPASPSSAETARGVAPGGDDERRAREEALARRALTQERSEAADKMRQDAQAGSALQQVDRLEAAPAQADAAAAKVLDAAPAGAPETAAPNATLAAPPAPAAAPAAASARAAGRASPADPLIASLPARAIGANRVSEILSPDPNVRWRAMPQGRVEFTTTGGREWTPATIGIRPGVAGAAFRDGVLETALGITAGASPDVQTCWLVGLKGVVLRSTDGRTFAPVAFPEAVDLRAIQATDAQRALVVAADGRRFETTDGGATWVVR
jgi:hypothetical protein